MKLSNALATTLLLLCSTAGANRLSDKRKLPHTSNFGTNITGYTVQMYGGPDGYQNTRAQITLLNGINTVGYIRFCDDSFGIPLEEDRKVSGIHYLHLPSTMYSMVVDLLRNEPNPKVDVRGDNTSNGFLFN